MKGINNNYTKKIVLKDSIKEMSCEDICDKLKLLIYKLAHNYNNCGEFEDIVFYADSNMILSIANRAVEFYLLKGVPRNGRYIPRLLFTTEKSVHLMTTFDGE